MIKVLGLRRLVILLILAGIFSFFAFVVYSYLEPLKLKKERELRRLRGEVSSVLADIDRMDIEFELLQQQQEKFKSLQERGFFSSQDRRKAELLFGRILKEAGVISSVANIGRGKLVEDKEAAKADYALLESPVSIKIEAMDDIDVYRYIYLLEKEMPGHLSIDELMLERQSDISQPLLRSIASGDQPKMVIAELAMTWRTMIPDADVISKEGK